LLHHGLVHAVTFSPDAKTVATASSDGTARLWDAKTGKPLGAPMGHEGPVRSVTFHPAGKLVLTASWDGTARLWELPPPVQGKVKRIVLWTQVLTGMELDAGGIARVLDAPTWQARREQLRELGGPPVP
jgi:WD40 repeat protein